MSLERARELLAEASADSKLLALQMIEAMDDDSLLGEVLALIDDPDPAIAERAGKASVKLVAKAGLDALRILGEWKQAHPELSAIFLLSGSTHNKLQVLRWLAHDRARSNPHIDAVLRTALQDADWEVRATALIVAARLRARELLREVLGTRLPEDTADGINADERRMLRTIQLCAAELLQGSEVPPPADSAPDTRAAMHAHLLRCLAGEPVSHHEKAFLFIMSMTTPLPDDMLVPASLPAGIVYSADRYVVGAHGLEICWVPPVDHWLGDELPRMQVANPIRRVRSAGFFIAREVSATPGLCDYDTAVEYCARLGAAAGLIIRLPTADEWEMAARGPDGRRFPWGNNPRAEARFGPSPWGLTDAVGRAVQWTSSARGSEVLVCGGEKQWVCAIRALAGRDALHAVRFVIEP
jgi:hypothetical protein